MSGLRFTKESQHDSDADALDTIGRACLDFAQSSQSAHLSVPQRSGRFGARTVVAARPPRRLSLRTHVRRLLVSVKALTP